MNRVGCKTGCCVKAWVTIGGIRGVVRENEWVAGWVTKKKEEIVAEKKTEQEDKKRFALWAKKETLQKIDEWYKKANCLTKSELVEKAVDFYVGYLSSNDNKEYLPRIVLSTLKGIVADSENKQSRVLFKLAVEMALMMNILAINLDIDQVSLERLRGECVREVKRLNGSFGMEDALDWQKGTEWRG